MRHLCLLILLLFFRKCWSYEKCPPDEPLLPCKCHHNEKIQCRHPGNYSLSHIFYILSYPSMTAAENIRHYHRTKDTQTNEMHFREFVLENPTMIILDKNLFGLFRFERIVFVNMKALHRLHLDVFNGTQKSVKSLTIKGPNQLGTSGFVSELFDALSTLVSVREMHLELENLSYIPNFGFRRLYNDTLKLESLRIISRSLYQIRSYAFCDLINIRFINIFSRTGIDHISGHAFIMNNGSDQTLRLDLSNNRLTNDKLEINSFSGANRPIDLELSNNSLTRLSEKVFNKFLHTNPNNRLFVNNNPLECDCGMGWLVNNRTHYFHQVHGAVCDDYAELWRLDEAYFTKCAQHDTQYMPRLLLRNHCTTCGNIALVAFITIFFAINHL